MINYTVNKHPDYDYLCLNPIPTIEEVNKYYAQEFYAQERPSVNDSQLALQQEGKDFFEARFEDIFRNGIEFFRHDKFTFFDIGFGYAQALLYMKERGIQVSGLEPTQEGYGYAKEQELQVYKHNIEDISLLPKNLYLHSGVISRSKLRICAIKISIA